MAQGGGKDAMASGAGGDVRSWLQSQVLDNGFNLSPDQLNKHYTSLFGEAPGGASGGPPPVSPPQVPPTASGRFKELPGFGGRGVNLFG